MNDISSFATAVIPLDQAGELFDSGRWPAAAGMFGEALRADPFEEVTVGKDDDAVEDGRARTMMGAAGGDSGSPVCCATP